MGTAIQLARWKGVRYGVGVSSDSAMMMRRRVCRSVRAFRRGLAIAPLAILASLTLVACSSLNPINLLRDATGTSDSAPAEDAPNAKNLEAGGQRAFPNLASVPPPPTRALSTDERAALTQHLAPDRANAKYIDEQLRIGPSAS